MSFKIVTKSASETIDMGETLAKKLKPGDIICLFGDLGAGKTTFVKGIAEGLKVAKSAVHSPTFVLMNIYEGKLPIYHFDLYRIEPEDGMLTVGYDEFFYGQGVSVIEWSERLGEYIPDEYLKVELKHLKENSRSVKFSSKGKRYLELIKNLQKYFFFDTEARKARNAEGIRK